MGVKDLWQLLAPVGRRLSVETLEGKILAIDMSIWLTQFIKAMRDEEGKMVKNAHLIGTLRRILKLLYHRIRPVFVFDGRTPALKERVVRLRRKTLEKHESARKASVHRIIMNQLKQQAAQQLQTLNNPPPSSLSSTKGDSKQYASTFQPPQPAWESKVDELDQSAATATAPSTSSQQSMVGEDDVQWTEGYEKLKAKPLDGSDESAEEEDAWNLPEDYSQLNAEVLSSLPAHIRKSIVEEARRKERARARAHYIPVAGNPLLYSQTQLANFLQTTKLNKRFEEAQKLIDGNTEGRTIAAEGGKRYKLIQSNVINSLSQSDIRSEQAEKPSSGVNHDESSDDEFTSRDWAYSAKHPSSKERGKQSTKHRKVIVDEESDDGDDARGDDGVGGGFFVDDNDVNTTPMPSAPPGNSAEHGAVTNQTTALKNAPTRLHASDSEEEGDDIEWEAEQCVSVDAEDAPREEIWNVAAVSTLDGVVEGNGVPHIEVVIQDTVSDSEEGKECSVDNQEGEIDLTADALIPKVSTSADLNSTLAVNLETAALDRAVETASKLADWAGRAVRRVLKDHVKKTISNVEAVSNQEVSEVEKSEPQSVSQSQQGVIFAYDDEQSQTWEPVEPNADSHPLSEFAGNSQAVNLLPDMNDYEMDNPEETYRRLVTSTRDSERLTEEMKEEVIQLLKAFDLPYIIAPFEAEAQCAVLEQLGLVNGVVTEDSDSFLFGAQAVFKNIFNDKKYVEVYLAEDVKRELGLSREDLIALAYFLGSDYTEGVHGIGIVNAMEIIQAFKANDGGALTGLNRFKDWLQGYDFAQEILEDLDKRQQKRKVKGKLPRRVDADDDSSTAGSDEAELKERHIATDENADDAIGYRTATDKRLVEFSAKHRSGRSKWTVPPSFPDERVARAYLEPQASRSAEAFHWPQPLRSKVRDFCKHVLGWTDTLMDSQIDPVLDQFSKRVSQTRIDAHYITYHDNTRFAKIASDRLRDAVVKITGKDTDLSLGAAPLPKRQKKRKIEQRVDQADIDPQGDWMDEAQQYQAQP